MRSDTKTLLKVLVGSFLVAVVAGGILVVDPLPGDGSVHMAEGVMIGAIVMGSWAFGPALLGRGK
jgi:hypothetical protein